MKNKMSILPIIGVILIGVFAPQVSASESENLKIFAPLRFFEFETSINISIDKSKIPVSPLEPSTSFDLDIKVNLSYEIPKFFPKFLLNQTIGKWILFRNKNHDGNVNVSISVSVPDWSTYELKDKKENLTINILSGEEASTKLKITVNSNVSALEKGDIKITAKFTPEENWGFKSSQNSTGFSILSKYVGNITAKIEELEGLKEYTIEPSTNVTFLLNITNNYNGETKVKIEFVDKSVLNKINWTAEIDPSEIVLSKGETKNVNVKVCTSSAREKEEVNLTIVLTPTSTSDKDIKDEYKVGNKIEYPLPTLVKAEIFKEIKIDWEIIIIALLVVVIAILAILLIRERKK